MKGDSMRERYESKYEKVKCMCGKYEGIVV